MVDEQRSEDQIAGQLSELEKQRIEDARTDQFRRIAARLYGMKPENVTPEQAGFVSNVWSGSLAMLAALAGPVTAIVALALQSIASRNEKATQGGKLSRLARRLVLGWRWRRVRTVTVPVEIPVEKEVGSELRSRSRE